MTQTPIQRTILWVVFGMSLLLLWDKWQAHNGQPTLFGGPSQAAKAGKGASDPKATGTSASTVGVNGAINGSANSAAKSDPSIPSATTTTSAAGAVPANGSSAGPSAGPANGAATAPANNGGTTAPSAAIELANDVLRLRIDPIGAQVTQSELLQHKDIDDPALKVALLQDRKGAQFLAQTGWVGTGQGGAFPNHRSDFTLVSNQGGVLRLAAESGGLKVARTMSLKPGEYVLTVTDVVSNTSAAPLQPTQYIQLTRDTHSPPGGSQFYSTFTGPVIFTDKGKFQKLDFSDIEKGKATFEKTAADGWLGVIQHYFVVAWIPADKVNREYYADKVDANLYRVGAKEPLAALAPGASATVESRLLIGPQDQKMLAGIAPGLDLTVDYGWLTAIAKPIFWLMGYLHGLVGNWGWAIVLLTIVIKTLFFPLQAASYKSMARMKAVTPRMTAIRERYGSDRVKMNQAMMELYKTEKINPLGGCLPVVVQIPVFIALYWVLLASVEMRSAPWILWIKDLAAPDPFYILPVVMAVTMFIQTKLNPTPPDPVQAKMMTIMPLVFSVMFFFFPAGLVLYWLVNNCYSIIQQWLITRKYAAGGDKKPA